MFQSFSTPKYTKENYNYALIFLYPFVKKGASQGTSSWVNERLETNYFNLIILIQKFDIYTSFYD